MPEQPPSEREIDAIVDARRALRRDAKAMPCPHCHVRSGQPCQTPTGYVRTLHKARLDAVTGAAA